MERYREVYTDDPPEELENYFISLLSDACRVNPLPEKKLRQILDIPTTYYKSKGWYLAVRRRGKELIVVTLFNNRGTGRRGWPYMYKYGKKSEKNKIRFPSFKKVVIKRESEST